MTSIQLDLLSYTDAMRKKRIQRVVEVLEQFPKARVDQKELLLQVWRKELGHNCFCLSHIRSLCSSPSGIDRDRRRPQVIKLFPRSSDKYEKYQSYRDEMSDGSKLRKWTDGWE